jgi:hypothetical protein
VGQQKAARGGAECAARHGHHNPALRIFDNAVTRCRVSVQTIVRLSLGGLSSPQVAQHSLRECGSVTRAADIARVSSEFASADGKLLHIAEPRSSTILTASLPEAGRPMCIHTTAREHFNFSNVMLPK